MSIDLGVKLTRPISIKVALPKIGAALQEILGLSLEPVIVAENYANGVRFPLQSKIISLDSDGILFEIANEPEAVLVGTYTIEHPLLSEEDQGEYVYANIGSQRSPLEYALAAAVAATFGRELGTPVNDDTPFYTEVLSQSADSFVNAIKLNDDYDDYRVAAQAFYDSLPRARG